MRDPFDMMAEALAELRASLPPLSGGVWEVESLGAGLYRLTVRNGDAVTPTNIVARPRRMALTLRAMIDAA